MNMLFVLLLASGVFRIDGQVVSTATSGRATLQLSDGRRVQNTEVDSDGRFQFRDIAEGHYSITVIMNRGRDVRRSVDVLESLAGKDGHIGIRIDMGDAVRASDQDETPAAALKISRAASDAYRQSMTPGLPLEESRRHLEKALALAPDYVDALNDLGVLHFRSGDVSGALELFGRAGRLDPRSFFAHVNRGGVLLETREYDEALKENLAAIRLRPEDSLAHAQAGIALYQLQRYDEAIPQLQQAKAQDPLILISPGFYLAKIYDLLGLREKAIEEYNQFLNAHPDDASAYIVRARIRELNRR